MPHSYVRGAVTRVDVLSALGLMMNSISGNGSGVLCDRLGATHLLLYTVADHVSSQTRKSVKRLAEWFSLGFTQN